MTEEEYRDMYREHCMEGGSHMTEHGFEEFKAYRKRVEKYFDNMKDSA